MLGTAKPQHRAPQLGSSKPSMGFSRRQPKSRTRRGVLTPGTSRLPAPSDLHPSRAGRRYPSPRAPQAAVPASRPAGRPVLGSGPASAGSARPPGAQPRVHHPERRSRPSRGPGARPGAGRDSPSYCRSTRTNRNGNTAPSRLLREPGATMSKGAEAEQQEGARPSSPRGAQPAAKRPPCVRSLSPSARPWRRLAPSGGNGGGRGPKTPRPRAPPPPPSNRLPPSRGAPRLAWVVVGAHWLRTPTPRPVPDRVTWKHKTRWRPPVVELSAGSKPSARGRGGSGWGGRMRSPPERWGTASRRGWRSDAGSVPGPPGERGGGGGAAAAGPPARTARSRKSGDVAEKLKAAREGTGDRVPGRKGA